MVVWWMFLRMTSATEGHFLVVLIGVVAVCLGSRVKDGRSLSVHEDGRAKRLLFGFQGLNDQTKGLLVAQYNPFTNIALLNESSPILMNSHDHGKNQKLLVFNVFDGLKDLTVLLYHTREKSVSWMRMDRVGQAKDTFVYLNIREVQGSGHGEGTAGRGRRIAGHGASMSFHRNFVAKNIFMGVFGTHRRSFAITLGPISALPLPLEGKNNSLHHKTSSTVQKVMFFFSETAFYR